VESGILLAFRFMRMQINIDIEKLASVTKSDVMPFIEKENENEIENEKEKENERENENEKESSSIAAVDISDPVANAEEAAAAASFNMEEAKEYCLKNVLPWFNSILKNADSKTPRIQDFNDQRKERFVAVHKKYGIGKEGTTGRHPAAGANGSGAKSIAFGHRKH